MNFTHLTLAIGVLASTTALTVPLCHASARSHTPSAQGFLGLNTTPSARFDAAGTARFSLSRHEKYTHMHAGVQIHERIFLNLRQTARSDDLFKGQTERLYPAVDTKILLKQENRFTPAIALGLQSAIGQPILSGEFLALSKRYNWVDFTLGMGWGRFGTAAHFDNPLARISTHFDRARTDLGEDSNTPHNWFTGKHVGIFGGAEIATPITGLSVKLDYGADRYTAEKQLFGDTAPHPVTAGLSYIYNNTLSAGIGVNGDGELSGRLTVKARPQNWKFSRIAYQKPRPYGIKTSAGTDHNKMKFAAQNEGLSLLRSHNNDHSIAATIGVPREGYTPQHIGRTLRHITANAGEEIHEIVITPVKHGLRGENIHFVRNTLDDGFVRQAKSPQEIWRNTTFSQDRTHTPRFLSHFGRKAFYALNLDTQLSLSDKDKGVLYRSAVTFDAHSSPFFGVITGLTARLNLHDNLENTDTLRRGLSASQSDVAFFSQKRIGLDRAFLGLTHSITPTLHASAFTGHLDEFHHGFGGEILFRPHMSRLAIGGDLWRTARRSPDTFLSLARQDDYKTHGFASLWYDIPRENVTLKARIGRYTSGDHGGAIGMQKTFEQGASLSATLSYSTRDHRDVFGGHHTIHPTLNFTLPLGSVKYTPRHTTLKTTITNFTRDTAIDISPPLHLYDITENLSASHLYKNWNTILD